MLSTLQLVRVNGRTLVSIDGVPRNLAMYSPPAMGRPDFDPVWRECVRRFARHDVDVYLMSVPQRWEQKFTKDNFWEGHTIFAEPQHLSLEKLDEGPTFVLEQRPDAYIILRFQARPPLGERYTPSSQPAKTTSQAGQASGGAGGAQASANTW